MHPLTMTLSSSSLGPRQPTKNLSHSWGKHSPQPTTHLPIKTKRTSLVTRDPKSPSPHWSSMESALLFLTGMEPHVQPIWSNSSLTRCLVVPLLQWGGSPGPPPGRRCWRCRNLLSQSGSALPALQHGCASLLRASCEPSRSGSSRFPLLSSLHGSSSSPQRRDPPQPSLTKKHSSWQALVISARAHQPSFCH